MASAASGISFAIILWLILGLISLCSFIYLFILLVKALRKYINSADTRKEQNAIKKSLGETLREYRTERKMTQEFVAEHLGISRQAVSKWESGISEPSTSNLLALAKLFDVPAEELLTNIR
ncbi:MAG: helix-turn-helix transcriptional regulator [Christensenellaceae bacterium]|nr:helix-turn-helix transcriptional regulator [Christensenellaceae bacterium]